VIALLRDQYSQPCPTRNNFNLLAHWFRSADLGNSPLLGIDREIYKREAPLSSLLALSPQQSPDPLSSFFLNVVLEIYHKVNIGLIERLRRRAFNLQPLDLEANSRSRKLFVYKEVNFLRLADVVGSFISSFWLVASIMTLYFIKDVRARLAVIAVFTTTFSLILSLLTRARKAEVFAGSAA
jgi:hypothetical protein